MSPTPSRRRRAAAVAATDAGADTDFALAVETFVQGIVFGRSRTHPYVRHLVGDMTVLRDAPRRNPRDLRNEEWVVHGVDPAVVDAAARRHAQGRYFVSAFSRSTAEGESLRQGYKELGYRLLRTEALFLHRLQRIPRLSAPATIERVSDAELAQRFAQATRSRPIPVEHLGPALPFRQYVAIDGDRIVGWVRSVPVDSGAWVANLQVIESHRRRGIAGAMMSRLLADDRRAGVPRSVLLASHTGALLYPHVGYEELGTLWLFAPRRTRG